MHQHDRAAQIYYLRSEQQATVFPAKTYDIHSQIQSKELKIWENILELMASVAKLESR